MADDVRWYAIHTYSGYENKVADSIGKVAENRGMADRIIEVAVPTETVKKVAPGSGLDAGDNANGTGEQVDEAAFAEYVESEGAKKSTRKNKAQKDEYERKLFPGYVLVKIAVEYDEVDEEYKIDDETWYLIRNTRGVTGFVGPEGKPVPLEQDEVRKFGVEKCENVEEGFVPGIDFSNFGRRVVEVGYKVGDYVSLVTMPGFSGVVQEIDIEHNTVIVVGSMFGGRETPVVAELDQVELVEK